MEWPWVIAATRLAFRSVSASIQKRWYHDGEEWKNASSLGLAELPQALAVLDLSLRYLSTKEADVTPS